MDYGSRARTNIHSISVEVIQGQMRVLISCTFFAAAAAACADDVGVILATHAVNKIANQIDTDTHTCKKHTHNSNNSKY